MPKRSRATTLKGLALAKFQRLDGAAYRGHPRKTDSGTPSVMVRCQPPQTGDGCAGSSFAFQPLLGKLSVVFFCVLARGCILDGVFDT